ncbi:MAG: hypothetical protein RL376_882, partial [Verrucomicrobiota bacterium]
MDDLETPTGGDATEASAKRIRKPAAKRSRARASVPEVADVLAFAAQTLGESVAAEASPDAGEAAAAPKRARGRRVKADSANVSAEQTGSTGSDGGATLFSESAGSADRSGSSENARAEAADAVAPSYANEAAAEPSAPFTASFSPDDPEPATQQADERPVFVPSGGASAAGDASFGGDENAGAGSGEMPAGEPPGGVGGGAGGAGVGAGFDAAGAARREERKSWWERKKEKKRQ